MVEQPEALFPATRAVISKAESKTAADCFKDFYRLQALKRQTQDLIANVDMLCVPTIPTFYQVSDLEQDPIQPNSNLGTYTNFVNLLDLCGIAVPTAPRADGRPGSITLLARAGEDHLTAGLASRVQQFFRPAMGATGWQLPKYEPQPAGQEETIDLAVVGAHMSGLPLNYQLLELNAQFKCKSKTANHYRLYRLAGGPPLRPGLVRDTSGHSIELEIWSLPKKAVGSFLAKVPAPLAIGTLTLEDGQQVKGFLCEEAAIAEAEDITRFHGWRAYLASQPSV